MQDPETTALLKIVAWCSILAAGIVLLLWQIGLALSVSFALGDNPDERLPWGILVIAFASYAAAPVLWLTATYLMARSYRVFIWFSPLLVGMAVMFGLWLLILRWGLSR